MLERILLVDDDENILSGYKRNLRSMFDITTYNLAEQALTKIKASPPFSVVISDFKMPVMNGVQFLSKVREISPDTVRLLLTGYADVTTAINAVNEGNVFRILTKPCDKETLVASIYAALEQYRLITAEKELLDKTLKGSIKILIDILSVVSPAAFSQANRFRSLAKRIARRMDYKRTWEIEVSALLSQIGCVAVPKEIINKRASGEELNDEEYNLFVSHPEVGKSLIKNIPRLDKIAENVAYQFQRYDGADGTKEYKIGDGIPLVARILKVVNDFDSYVKSGITRATAIEIMKADSGCYDSDLLSALEAEISGVEESLVMRYVNIAQLEAGMILLEDITDINNFLLVSKDNEVSEVLLAKIKNYAKLRKIIEPIKVLQER